MPFISFLGLGSPVQPVAVRSQEAAGSAAGTFRSEELGPWAHQRDYKGVGSSHLKELHNFTLHVIMKIIVM